MNKVLKFFKKLFGGIYKILDVILITPLSKLIYNVGDFFTSKGGTFDKIINNSNTLVYVSLVFAFVTFFAVDKKVINLTETEAVVLTNQVIKAEYNEEKYVVEGIPETADIVLMGRKSDLYLAEQLGDHQLTLDLTELSEGTHKVNIKYNNPINTLDYKLDPSRVTIVIYPKVSESKTVTTDILNTDKLDSKLVVSSVELDRDEVIVKSYKEKLSTVASVKALVDVSALNATTAGTYTLDNVKLVAYDDNGTEITDVQIVPETVTATVVISSPSKLVNIKVVPEGNVASGSAISTINSSVTQVTLYGEEKVLENISEIEVPINVEGLNNNKTYQETIAKPYGVRSMSETAITINVEMQTESSKVLENIPVVIENLDTTKYTAKALENSYIDVTVKGVDTILKKITDDNKETYVTAYVDLEGLEEGEHTVPIYVTGSDNKLIYIAKTTTIKIMITKIKGTGN